MPAKISFADLTHTGQIVAANTFPLGIGLVAAYAKQELGDAAQVHLFRYPADFSAWLEHDLPDVACFSNYSWCLSLAHEYACQIKGLNPRIPTIFGGPNYPTADNEQAEFLAANPAIDFYVDGEGEFAFVHLFRALKTHGFDAQALKAARTAVPNTHYLVDGELVKGTMLERIQDMTALPSPYLTGLMDKFFDESLTPMIQTTRGCPYTCSFCHEGHNYFNKTRRFPQERISAEIDYIAQRTKVPDFIIVDSNFGMFEEDLDTTRTIARMQAERSWPTYLIVATAKNHKARVIEAAKMLNGALPPGASIQTTDATVLGIVKRKNLSLEQIIEVARTADTQNANSFSEIILCLPGDSQEAHFRSVADIIDTGINYVRIYQFMMLHGTEAAGKASRQKHAISTRFRVLPRCFGSYAIRGQSFPVAEIEEISVANGTMPYENYQNCRDLDLSVELFNNGGLFADLLQFAERHGVSRSRFIMDAHHRATDPSSPLRPLFDGFREEEKRNLRLTYEELQQFVQTPGVVERYIEGEFGTNELYKFRALATFEQMAALHDLAFASIRALIAEGGTMDEKVDLYLDQLKQFSLLRKSNLLDTAAVLPLRFQFDFQTLLDGKFTDDPLLHLVPQEIDIELFHTPEQINSINAYVKQYGTSLVGLGRILLRANVRSFYRSARRVPALAASA